MLPKSYLCYRAEKPITLDGRLDKAVWEPAPWTDAFADIQGERLPSPPLRTRVKMLWDDTYFYIGAELEEPHVWATLTQRDSIIFQDNDFELFLDPDGDNHQYYEFEINALNTVWDLLLIKPYRDGGPAVNGWDIAGLRTAVHIDGTLNDPTDTDHGWSVEIALPWSALKECAHRSCPPTDGDQWRINFSRVEWQTEIRDGSYRKIPNTREDNWVWSPQEVIDMHRPEKWGYVQFCTDPPGSAVFHPDPTAAARDLLHTLYYAQRAYHKEHGRYFQNLSENDLLLPSNNGFISPLRLETTEVGFVASLEITLPTGQSQTLHIREDSWLVVRG